MSDATEVHKELTALVNRLGLENASDTPDFIIASFLHEVLGAWNTAVQRREQWYGRRDMDAPTERRKGRPVTIADIELSARHAARAAVPAEDPVCECGHQRGVHIGLLGAKRLQCGLCRCDEFALSIPEPAERWREPQIGDHVKVSGTIQSIEGGIAQVALYRSYPVGAVQAMQCGALEYVPARDGGEDAPAEEGGGG